MLRIFITAALISAPLSVFGQNTSDTNQTGDNNEATTTQAGDNDAHTTQVGDNNSASIGQNGRWNSASIAQVGDNFSRSVNQNGNYQGYGSFQFSAPRYTGSFSTYSQTWGSGGATTTLEFGINN
ncbi:hypothetical protein [Falsihalocynthiibacter arcticus]|uniref:Curlin n=1 Tax=Falsihalocynthiibacter arcticus TaxID=1579316 RepID=A0A126V0L5_9RHOB|nr:hypothetical protein RC74_09700 [Falsihalocynthiibacter arcticus]